MKINKVLHTSFKRYKFIYPYCDFLRPNCMCAIGTRVANDNENVIVNRYRD